jgi:hypothetical protein
MTVNQMKFIFKNRDDFESIKKNFHSITLTANYIIYIERYKDITIDYSNQLLITTSPDGHKEYFDFVDINLVRESKVCDNPYMQELNDKIVIPY